MAWREVADFGKYTTLDERRLVVCHEHCWDTQHDKTRWVVAADGCTQWPWDFHMKPLEEAFIASILATASRIDAQKRTRRRPHHTASNGTRRRPLPTYWIAERDGWICHLCGGPIDRRPHGWGVINYQGASADHVVPHSKGGSDDVTNLRAAHWMCNVLRGNRELEGSDAGNTV